MNGLSTYTDLSKACGGGNTKAQKLMLNDLEGISDLAITIDPNDSEHYFLQGDTEQRHDQWAATRAVGSNDQITLDIKEFAHDGFDTCQ